MTITEPALARLRELEPELMSRFGWRKFALGRGCHCGSSATNVEQVEAWLLERGVRATLELQGSVLNPIHAELVPMPIELDSRPWTQAGDMLFRL